MRFYIARLTAILHRLFVHLTGGKWKVIGIDLGGEYRGQEYHIIAGGERFGMDEEGYFDNIQDAREFARWRNDESTPCCYMDGLFHLVTPADTHFW